MLHTPLERELELPEQLMYDSLKPAQIYATHKNMMKHYPVLGNVTYNPVNQSLLIFNLPRSGVFNPARSHFEIVVNSGIPNAVAANNPATPDLLNCALLESPASLFERVTVFIGEQQQTVLVDPGAVEWIVSQFVGEDYNRSIGLGSRPRNIEEKLVFNGGVCHNYLGNWLEEEHGLSLSNDGDAYGALPRHTYRLKFNVGWFAKDIMMDLASMPEIRLEFQLKNTNACFSRAQVEITPMATAEAAATRRNHLYLNAGTADDNKKKSITRRRAYLTANASAVPAGGSADYSITSAILCMATYKVDENLLMSIKRKMETADSDITKGLKLEDLQYFRSSFDVLEVPAGGGGRVVNQTLSINKKNCKAILMVFRAVADINRALTEKSTTGFRYPCNDINSPVEYQFLVDNDYIPSQIQRVKFGEETSTYELTTDALSSVLDVWTGNDFNHINYLQPGNFMIGQSLRSSDGLTSGRDIGTLGVNLQTFGAHPALRADVYVFYEQVTAISKNQVSVLTQM